MHGCVGVRDPKKYSRKSLALFSSVAEMMYRAEQTSGLKAPGGRVPVSYPVVENPLSTMHSFYSVICIFFNPFHQGALFHGGQG